MARFGRSVPPDCGTLIGDTGAGRLPQGVRSGAGLVYG